MIEENLDQTNDYLNIETKQNENLVEEIKMEEE